MSLAREDGGWNAEEDVKDFNRGVSPVMENIGLELTLVIVTFFDVIMINVT